MSSEPEQTQPDPEVVGLMLALDRDATYAGKGQVTIEGRPATYEELCVLARATDADCEAVADARSIPFEIDRWLAWLMSL